MAFICLAVKPQANTSDLASNALLKKLLELHQYYCGEAATCGSSEHVEPSEFLLPVPCCIPCSCLPSCVEQQNCCPVSVNGTLTEPMTTSRLNTIVQENEKIKSNNGLVSDTNDMTLFDWNKTGENKAEIETDEIRIENSTTFTSMDSEILEMIETERANEKCTRPQVLYKPNRYLDSEAYMMVRDCPDGFEDRLIIDKCNAGIDEVGLLDMIPVTSKLSGVAYKNKHCLMCNEKQQAEHMIEWRVEFVSSGARREHIFFPNPDAVVDTLIEKRKMFNNIHFVPNNESMSRPCKLYDITTCNQTGLWDVYDEFIETVCLNGYQLPIISKINNQMFTFNNIGCLHCNTGMDLREERLSCSYWENRSKSYFSVTLNLRSIVPNDQIRPLLELAPYIEHDSLQQLPHRRCPAGKLDLLVSTI